MALGNKLGALYFSKGTTLTFVDLTPKQWRGVCPVPGVVKTEVKGGLPSGK